MEKWNQLNNIYSPEYQNYEDQIESLSVKIDQLITIVDIKTAARRLCMQKRQRQWEQSDKGRIPTYQIKITNRILLE